MNASETQDVWVVILIVDPEPIEGMMEVFGTPVRARHQPMSYPQIGYVRDDGQGPEAAARAMLETLDPLERLLVHVAKVGRIAEIEEVRL